MRNLIITVLICICCHLLSNLLSNFTVLAADPDKTAISTSKSKSVFLRKEFRNMDNGSSLKLITNQFSIVMGDCFYLTNLNLSAIDMNTNSSANMIYYLYNIVNVNITLNRKEITVFSQSNILVDGLFTDHPVIFCHDNSNSEPQFDFAISNGIETSSLINAKISLYPAWATDLNLMINYFEIVQGACFYLNNKNTEPPQYNLNADDIYNLNIDIVYYIFNTNHLSFSINSKPINKFSQSNIPNSSVVSYDSVLICHDNSKETPSFEFIISNGIINSTLNLANITFIATNSTGSSNGTSNTTIIVAVTVSVGLFLLITIIGICLLRKYKKQKSNAAKALANYQKPQQIKKKLQINYKGDANLSSLLLSEIEIEEKTGYHLPSSIKDLLIQNPLIGIPYKELEVFRDFKLGVGGYGIVYKGAWNGKDIAVKELLINGEINKEIAEEFAKEIDVWYQLTQDNIIKLYGISISLIDNNYLMIMEIAEKGSLDKLLKTQSEDLSWKKRMEIALDVIYGIKYLHELKIVHRDIKSGNILIDGNLKAKISDFGIAKIKKDCQMTKSVGQLGTVTYMAPELFQLSTNYTNESDIYAFGIVLWELMENKKPGKKFKNTNEIDWPIIMEKLKIEDREEISEESLKNHRKLCNLIRECWKFEAKERPNEDKIIEVLKNEEINL